MKDEEIGNAYQDSKIAYEAWRLRWEQTETHKKNMRQINISLGIALALALPIGILLAYWSMQLIKLP